MNGSRVRPHKRIHYAKVYLMTTKNLQFARNLVKGKIAETIFAQMLRETGLLKKQPPKTINFCINYPIWE